MKHRLLASAATLTLTAFISAAPGWSQDAPDDPQSERDIIIVEASRTRIDALEYPGMVSRIDAESLDLARASDLDDLLRDLPGTEISGGPRRTGQTISLRGQGRENTTLLLDGARQNFGSAHDGALFVDPSLIVSVESMRGPASALYGSGASGGVISLRTATARDMLADNNQSGFRLGAGYHSASEEVRGSATGFALFGDTDILASVSHRTSGDIDLGSGDTLPADDMSTSFLLNLGQELAVGVRAELSIQSFNGEATEPNNGQGVAEVGAFNALVDKDIRADNIIFNFDIAPHGALDWLDMDVSVYRNTSGVDETEQVGGRFLQRELETTGLRIDQRFAFALRQFDAGLTIGGEFYRDKQTGFDSNDPDGIRGGAPTAQTEFSAIYTQLELDGPAPFNLPGRIILLPGMRLDSFDSQSAQAPDASEDQTSGRLGASWVMSDSFSVFANWGEAFRAPSINELYLDGTHFSFPHIILGAPTFISNDFIANPDLLPEETKSFEAGFAISQDSIFAVNDHLEVKLAWFEIEAENLINLQVNFAFDPTCFTPPFMPCSAGTTQSSNVGRAELSGYEAELSYGVGDFDLNASLSHIDGLDLDTGEALGGLTPTRLILDGRWSNDARRLVLGSRVEFAANFENSNDPAQHRDSYAVVDVYGRWQMIADQGLTLNVGINNVFDTDYERVFAGVSEPARSFRLDLGWTGTF